MENLVKDPVWMVRLASALAPGECKAAKNTEVLRDLLQDPYRPVRIGAAAAIWASGGEVEAEPPSLLDTPEVTPKQIGDLHDSIDWLTRLAGAYAGVLSSWKRHEGAPGSDNPVDWAQFLAGPLGERPTDTRHAEIQRYVHEKTTHYNFTKPFTRVNREQNAKMLHSFLVVAEHLRIPLGAKVVDLAGGAGWVSELLAKFGYRPITTDIAMSLLRVGKDRFTREHLSFWPVGADMTHLPFGSASVDAVVVVDALHHSTDVRTVFHEAFRILADGGMFLMAEAGEGHSETEDSRAEARFGIREGEIHLPDAVRYAEDAGFDNVIIVPHYFPTVGITLRELQKATTSRSERLTIWRDGERLFFDELVMQSIRTHPILVCRKGQRALDSRMPRALRARMEPRLSREGLRLHGAVEVWNRGDTLWLAGGDEPGRVRLGLQLFGPDRSLLNMDFHRVQLPNDVPPGGRAELPVDVALPEDVSYVVKLDLVDEHICWFEDEGNDPVYLAI